MSRTPEIDGTMQVCRELGIAFVPYAPLGRQYLTALGRTSDFYDEGDCRKMFPRFQREHMKKIRELFGRLWKWQLKKRVLQPNFAWHGY